MLCSFKYRFCKHYLYPTWKICLARLGRTCLLKHHFCTCFRLSNCPGKAKFVVLWTSLCVGFEKIKGGIATRSCSCSFLCFFIWSETLLPLAAVLPSPHTEYEMKENNSQVQGAHSSCVFCLHFHGGGLVLSKHGPSIVFNNSNISQQSFCIFLER